jgi:thiamine transport system substrate-binding protein
MRHTILAAGLTLVAGGAMAQVPVLTVYTYDSFVPEWGPRPGDRGGVRGDLRLRSAVRGRGRRRGAAGAAEAGGRAHPADVVLGLDTNLTAAAAETGLFAPHGVTAEGLTLPVAWDDPVFLPFDWGYFAFVMTRRWRTCRGISRRWRPAT